MMVPTSTVLDLTPQALADALDAVYRAVQETDREAAVILRAAREGLRNLSYNRWAAAKTRESRAYRLRRRHQGRQEGQDHA